MLLTTSIAYWFLTNTMKFDSSALSIRSLLESQMLSSWGIPCMIFNRFNLTLERPLSKSWLSETFINWKCFRRLIQNLLNIKQAVGQQQRYMVSLFTLFHFLHRQYITVYFYLKLLPRNTIVVVQSVSIALNRKCTWHFLNTHKQ